MLAVVVIYGRPVTGIDAWPTLKAWLEEAPPAGFGLRAVLFYDNSPTAQVPPDTAGCTYVHDPSNGGTAAGYAHAVQHAAERGCDWLLLLDQDTSLPGSFLAEAARALARPGAGMPIALVPRVRSRRGQYISPARLTVLGSFRPIGASVHPPAGQALFPVASGSLLRRSALAALMPLPDGLWLDFVDHWIFRQLQARGGYVAVLDQVLEHDLSVLTPWAMSAGRLRGVIRAEAYFYSQLGLAARLVYPWRLAWRLARLALRRPGLVIALLQARPSLTGPS